MKHHHHFYDKHDLPAILVHAHPYDNVRHVEESIPKECPVYWDHEVDGVDCSELEEKP